MGSIVVPETDKRILSRGKAIYEKSETKICPGRQGLSQGDLAQICGVSRQTINAIEKGDYNPTVNLCIAICRALGKTLDELFWEDENDEE